ncbi:hypothetical protein A1O7_03342 [Cladophialophora yegresii CBS 114405]|uniref:Zn(2)-C6 fungal-type domain-containing protein n=1 Tax=Cladophialophora yegresii CBS 114405 TaxID=1182544 RepID=W9WXB9_9EURO|nr:uncharacterized protein A1O7_03342 [Cladophialophora yegresii CBS 114405]EXJ62899.1 hypothetical protein A1O7_03342 [Cladophialophora yegresii CBS 114405]
MAALPGAFQMAEHAPLRFTTSRLPTTIVGRTRSRWLACDSCKSSKNRCERASEAVSCNRCLKANRLCVVAGVILQVPAYTASHINQQGKDPTSAQIWYIRKTCDACHASKVKCERTSESMQQCDRCAKTGRECITTPSTGPRYHCRRLEVLPLPTGPNTALDINIADTVAATNTPLAPATHANHLGAESRWNGALEQDSRAAGPSDAPTEALQNGVATHITRQNYQAKLGELQREVLADLELVKYCKAADKCPEATLPPELGYNSSFLVGRMLAQSKTLLEILDLFGPAALAPTPSSEGAAPDGISTTNGSSRCDVPSMFSLFSCFVCLIRIYRTNFSSILDSMPMLFGLERPVPQLFPGLNLGGFSLDYHLDLQVQLLLQISNETLSKLKAKFGIADVRGLAGKSVFEPDKTRMLVAMLGEEAREQPPLHEPRGHCAPLSEILKDLHHIIQAEKAKRQQGG